MCWKSAHSSLSSNLESFDKQHIENLLPRKTQMVIDLHKRPSLACITTYKKYCEKTYGLYSSSKYSPDAEFKKNASTTEKVMKF